MKHAFKWIARVLGGLVVLFLIIGFVMYLIGGTKVNQTFAVQLASLTIPTDSTSIARGAYLGRTNGCTDCHGESLSGQVYVDAPPFRMVAVNLTSGAGGIGGNYSAEDWDRAIRHGVKPDGGPVFIMPSAAFHSLSDEDAAALIAYLQQVPPVDNELPPSEIRVPGRIMAAAFLDLAEEVRTEPARSNRPDIGPTAEYGAYLVSGTCAYCHGDDLLGAQPNIPDSPLAPSLETSGQWTFEEFTSFLQTGTKPNGQIVSREFMPISLTSQFDSTEVAALHTYLGTLQAITHTASDG